MVNEAMVVSTINPLAEEFLAQYEIMDKAKVAHIVNQTIGAFAESARKSADIHKSAELFTSSYT